MAMTLAFAAPDASAVDYPARPIKLVVPYAAGGPTDVLGRVVADYLGRDLKQTTIVENKPGAQGAIGAEAVARADPDGYTLFVAAGSIIVLNPMLYKKLSYDPLKDFRMLALVTDLPVVSVWYGIAAPSRLPDDVAQKISASHDRALNDELFRASLEKIGFPVFRPRSAAAIQEFIDADRARWSAVIRAQNISLD
jgi:tripartite-type tricarboxylate transporter receptor subunit TctC